MLHRPCVHLASSGTHLHTARTSGRPHLGGGHLVRHLQVQPVAGPGLTRLQAFLTIGWMFGLIRLTTSGRPGFT